MSFGGRSPTRTSRNAQGVQFDNLGDLISSAILDEDLFDQLSALILLFSGARARFGQGSGANAG